MKKMEPAPPPVIRGVLCYDDTETTDFIGLDYLSVTFRSDKGERFLKWFQRFFNQCLNGPEVEPKHNKRYNRYKMGSQLLHNGSEMVKVGWGGNEGTCNVTIKGFGCGFISVDSWGRIARLVSGRKGWLCRVDVCIDFLTGRHTVQEVEECYTLHPDMFSRGGRVPSPEVHGDPTGVNGWTFQVGNHKSPICLQAYEKGKQMHSVRWPAWCRYEVRFTNANQPVDQRILEPDNWLKFFRSAFPFCWACYRAIR